MIRVAAFLLLFTGQLMAEVISYQGRVIIDGKPFNGTARFKFAIINAQGSQAWSSGDMVLDVRAGIYEVRLGDSVQAPPIDGALLADGNSPKLRIWIDRAGQGWASLGDDVPLASARIPAAAPSRLANDSPQSATGPGGSAAVLAELHAIHTLLISQQGGGRQREALEIVSASIDDLPSLGKENAPLVLLEFVDFENPLCTWYQREVFEKLKTRYVDSGSVRIVSEVLPEPFNSSAELAARAAVYARAQGKYWPLRERLMAADGTLAPDRLAKVAAEVGLDPANLAANSSTKETDSALQKAAADARAAGIDSAPGFVLGRATNGIVTGIKMNGAQPFARMEAEIDKLLPSKGAR